MSRITDKMLKAIMPHAPSKVRAIKLPLLNAAALHYGITTKKRVAAWLATLAIESGEFRYSEEIASGAAYEGRRDLGNTQPGDGKRFKGRGDIQGTGRDVYQAYTDYVRKSRHLPVVDFIANPKMLGKSPYSEDFAAWFCNGYKKLLDEADAGNFLAFCIGVNGRRKTRQPNGTFVYRPNHWAERSAYYRKALEVIPDDFKLIEIDVQPPVLPSDVIESNAATLVSERENRYPDFDPVTGGEIPSEKDAEDLSAGQDGENAADGEHTQEQPITQQDKPADLIKEQPSVFVKWMTAIKIFLGTMLAGVTSWCSGNEIATTVGNKAVEQATPDIWPKIAMIVLYAVVGIGAGVFLIWIASIFYEKSAKRANDLNTQKADAAASKDKITYEFTKR